MKILNVADFKICDDPVKTEETINEQLLTEINDISDNYIYVQMPLAWLINNRGLLFVQNLIDSICVAQKNIGPDKQLIFVCQHIQVTNLNFHGNLVFTPHATLMDSFYPLPHYSCNYDLKLARKFNQRKYLMSFVGDFNTHKSRKRLHSVLKDNKDCFTKDTGNWHFYSELLGNSKISLCPRGTGPSTIRLWESLAMGCVPLIISDYLKMPLDFDIEWESVAIFVKQKEIENLMSYIPENSALESMAKHGNEIYKKYFSNENLAYTIKCGVKQ